jgi:hypothetical protein
MIFSGRYFSISWSLMPSISPYDFSFCHAEDHPAINPCRIMQRHHRQSMAMPLHAINMHYYRAIVKAPQFECQFE